MKVKARLKGFYNDQIRQPGSIFVLEPKTVKVGDGHRYVSESGSLLNGVMHNDKHYGFGEEFTITPEEQFSTKWMISLDPPKPKKKPGPKPKVSIDPSEVEGAE